VSSAVVASENNPVHQRGFVAQVARRIPAFAETRLGQHLWARGYFCATVGTVTQEQIQEYIDKDEQQSPDENFHIDP
jgi:putative transposase